MIQRRPVLRTTEHEEQRAVIEWARLNEGRYPQLRLLHSSLNGAKLAGGNKQGKLLKDEGMKAGVPDLHLPVARHGWHSLFIELKRQDGIVKNHQAAWLDMLTEEGNLAVACFGADQAIATLEEYLDGD